MRQKRLGIRQAMRLEGRGDTALVGAGGKTSVMFGLAREFDVPVVLSASAHMGVEQAALADNHKVVHSKEDLLSYTLQLPAGTLLLMGDKTEDARLEGLNAPMLSAVSTLARKHKAPLIIEADGARMLPLKAPAAHEPPIPEFVETVVVVAGLSGLNARIDEVVHRPEYFCDLIDKRSSDLVEADDLVKVLAHPEGGLRNIPENARKILLLNHARTDQQRFAAKKMAERLVDVYDQVISADIVLHSRPQIHAVFERTAGVILAAGGSKRMGKTKQLLEWKGQTLIRRAVETALKSSFSEVVVVLGADAENIRSQIEDLPVKIVVNPQWAEGQSTSVKSGMKAVSEGVGGVVFLLADQPAMHETLIDAVIESHQKTLSPITLPMIDGRRGSPVLFDRSVFADLGKLEGDAGGRQLFSRHDAEFITWLDPGIDADIDTEEHYLNLVGS